MEKSLNPKPLRGFMLGNPNLSIPNPKLKLGEWKLPRSIKS